MISIGLVGPDDTVVVLLRLMSLRQIQWLVMGLPTVGVTHQKNQTEIIASLSGVLGWFFRLSKTSSLLARGYQPYLPSLLFSKFRARCRITSSSDHPGLLWNIKYW